MNVLLVISGELVLIDKLCILRPEANGEMRLRTDSGAAGVSRHSASRVIGPGVSAA